LVSTILLLLAISAAMVSANNLELNHSFATTGDIQPAKWRMKLEFNQPVSVLEVSKRITIKIDNKPGSFKIINSLSHEGEELEKSLPPERKIFVIGPEKETIASSTIQVIAAKGLYSADGQSFMPNDIMVNFRTSASISLLGNEPFFFEKDDKGIFIDMSEDVKDFKLKKHLRIFPPVGYFTVSRQYYNDRHRYKIAGKFVTGRKYEIRINGGAVEGESQLLNNAKISFTAKGPAPEIAFGANRSVLELKSRQLVPLSFTGVGNFKCQLMRIPAFFGPAMESLTAFAEAEDRRPNENNIAKVEGEVKQRIDSAAARLDNQMLDIVKQFENLKAFAATNKTADIEAFLSPAFSSDSQAFLGSENPDQAYHFSLPLDFRPEPEKGGSVIVNVSETDVESGQIAARLFQVTDLAITYKFSRNEILLWITSIETGKPSADTAIMLVDKSGRHFFPGRTNHDGLLRINEAASVPFITFAGNVPQAGNASITIAELVIAAAASAADSSFISLNTNRFFPAAVTQSSPDLRLDLSGKGHVFTERGVYKPGETVFWKATARSYRDNGIVPMAGDKVKVIVTTSRGEDIYDEVHTFNDYGTCSGSIQLKNFHPLGQYNLRLVEVASDTADAQNNSNAATASASVSEARAFGQTRPEWDYLMNRTPGTVNQPASSESDTDEEKTFVSTSFQVQEFEPPRHFVKIDMTSEKRKIRQIVGRESDQLFLDCKIKAAYYTGGPVRHAKVQWTAHLTERDSSVSGYPLFQFGNNDIQKELIESGNSILDKNGELTISLPVSQSVQSGLNSIEISATVWTLIPDRYNCKPVLSRTSIPDRHFQTASGTYCRTGISDSGHRH
jgi:hypothetical protein